MGSFDFRVLRVYARSAMFRRSGPSWETYRSIDDAFEAENGNRKVLFNNVRISADAGLLL